MIKETTIDIRQELIIKHTDMAYTRLTRKYQYGIPEALSVYIGVQNNMLSELVTYQLAHDNFEYFNCHSYDAVLRSAQAGNLEYLQARPAEVIEALEFLRYAYLLDDGETTMLYNVPALSAW